MRYLHSMVLVVINLHDNARDMRCSSIPQSGRFPEEGNGDPFQNSCLENPIHRGAKEATVYRAAQSDTTEAT